jgi:hypothetical protein
MPHFLLSRSRVSSLLTIACKIRLGFVESGITHLQGFQGFCVGTGGP